eukprot:TRINITY_DN476_c0_g1_i2.p1 TRINITY_DN476_c0_g1~~TRINITY_DN476_c0_g1_i2.p1  ORF type:complete len:146 (-),score=28.92 TRINITY_DN476_c0_g1_i2:142-579(-)
MADKQSLGWVSMTLCLIVTLLAVASTYTESTQFSRLTEALTQVSTIIVTLRADAYVFDHSTNAFRAAAAGFIISAVVQYFLLFMHSLDEKDKDATTPINNSPAFYAPPTPSNQGEVNVYYPPQNDADNQPPSSVIYSQIPEPTKT